MSTNRERLEAACLRGARFDEPCPFCGGQIADDEDEIRRHYLEGDAYDNGVKCGTAELAEIRSLAAQSTSPGARELMPPRLEELLFPGTDRLPYAKRRFSVVDFVRAFPNVEIVEPEIRELLAKGARP